MGAWLSLAILKGMSSAAEATNKQQEDNEFLRMSVEEQKRFLLKNASIEVESQIIEEPKLLTDKN